MTTDSGIPPGPVSLCVPLAAAAVMSMRSVCSVSAAVPPVMAALGAIAVTGVNECESEPKGAEPGRSVSAVPLGAAAIWTLFDEPALTT
jgi:hypothetical protein